MLRNSVSHVAEYDSEVGVNTSANLFYENILGISCGDRLHWSRRLRLVRVLSNRTALCVKLLRLLRLSDVSGRYDALSIILIVRIVSEKIILFSVDDSFNNFTAVVTLNAENSCDDIHNYRPQRRKSHKDALNDAAGKLL